MGNTGTSDAIRKAGNSGVTGTAGPAGCAGLSADDKKRVRQILISMLNDIQDVAESNGITFELGGGSVLGAVRHKGFIPWDDDIDINITRREWNRLLPLLRSSFGSKYDILTPGCDGNYALLFPQIRLSGTVLRTRDDLRNDRCGVPVDVFIIENTYGNAVLRFFHMLGCQYYGFVTSCRKFYRDRSALMPFALSTGNKKLISSTRSKIFLGRLISFMSLQKLASRADRWNGRCRDDDSVWVTVPTGRRHFRGELRRRDVFFPASLLEFEGRLRPCPGDADAYLTKLYGNYIEIPEEADRESHLYFEVQVT